MNHPGLSVRRPDRKPRVLVAMSGGVDSSVAAAFLKEQGYDVIGVTMQVWDYSKSEVCETDQGKGTCCSSIDVDDARSVADHLGIPFYVINCESEFKTSVIDPFISQYLEGKTPIPCVNCNTFMKFDHLVTKMVELECDFLATGHYAQIKMDDANEPMIVTSEDGWKDQTYFLFTLQKKLLGKLLFPVGDWVKSDIRAYAEKHGLPVARKKDSTGICFLGSKSHGQFIKEQVASDLLSTGAFRLYPTGEKIGDHDGIHNFTYGQRKGLRVSWSEPLFVIKIDPQTQDVWLGTEENLFSNKLTVKNVNFFREIQPDGKYRVKIRFQHLGAEARVVDYDGEKVEIEFDQPQRAVTPGQAAVFYNGKELLGGGWII
jgi:tRNA-specific 2-thiouridylase